MPHFVVGKIHALNNHGKAVKVASIHIFGIAYKRNFDDMQESPALDLILLLKKLGTEVSYSDPYVPEVKLDSIDLTSQDALSSAKKADCCVIITDHSNFDYKGLVDSASLIVDTRNAFCGFESDKIVRLQSNNPSPSFRSHDACRIYADRPQCRHYCTEQCRREAQNGRAGEH